MENRKERIAAAAVALFARHGVDAVTVDDIAKAAGVSQGLLYRYYRNKESMARELFREGYLDFARAMRRAIAATPGLRGRVERLTALFCDGFARRPDLFRFMLLHQHDHLNALTPEDDTPPDVLEDVVGTAAAAGEIPPIDPALGASVLMGVPLQAAVFHAYGRLADLSVHEAALAAAILRALGARDHGGRA